MPTDRQIIFLIRRFNGNKKLIKQYLTDLCRDIKVHDLAKTYDTNQVQIQRDRNNFTQRKIAMKVLKIINEKDEN